MIMFSPIITIFIIIFTLFIIICFRSKYEKSHFNNIKLSFLSNKIDKNYSFVFLTDLHEKEYGHNNNTLINYVNNLNKDIIIGGDFITFTRRNNRSNVSYTKNTINLINNISKINNIYYAFGNHELRLKYKQDDNDSLKNAYNEFISTLDKNNIKLLDNSFIDLDNNIRLYGFTLKNKYYKKRKNLDIDYKDLVLKDINDIIGKLDNTKYNICLLHNPDYADMFIDHGFDMVLSGHHHGGLIRLPFVGSILSPDMRLLPKYSKGLYHYKNKILIVSGGLGEHTVKIRLNNKCELYTITIKRENGTNTI